MKTKFFDIVAVTAIALVMIGIYVGFFFPDQIVLRRGGVKPMLFWLRILMIPAGAGVIWVYLDFRKSPAHRANIILGFFGLLAGLVLVTHFGIFAYDLRQKLTKEIRFFHPYLQLQPHSVDSAGLSDTTAFRIVCLGGSTTEFRNTQEVGWPEMVETELRQKTGDNSIKVFNCGRQWYTSLHLLINYETNIRQFHPDVIIVMEAINDLVQNADESYFSGGGFRGDYGHFYGPAERLVSGYGFIREFYGKILFRLWFQHPRRIIEKDEFPGLVAYKNYLTTLIDITGIDAARMVLMTQPTLLKPSLLKAEQLLMNMVNVETCGKKSQWSYGTAFRGMEQYNNTVRQIGSERRIPVIDLEKAVPKDTGYFWDEVHYCDSAFPVIAKTVADALLADTNLCARLALAARKTAYGEKGVVTSGPLYRSMTVKGDSIVIAFSAIGSGLLAKGGGELKRFALAGEDRNFVWAHAKIADDQVIVWDPHVKKPVAVRYAWANNPEGANLYNREGLPASPFRTDDWQP